MPSTPPHIIIVGTGIVGASIAYHLAGRKARVTLLDHSNGLGGEVTAKSFAWITAAHTIHFPVVFVSAKFSKKAKYNVTIFDFVVAKKELLSRFVVPSFQI